MRRISILSMTIALLGAIVGCSEPRIWSAVYFNYYGHFNIGVEMEDLEEIYSEMPYTDTVYISHQIADSILQGIKEIKMSKYHFFSQRLSHAKLRIGGHDFK